MNYMYPDVRYPQKAFKLNHLLTDWLTDWLIHSLTHSLDKGMDNNLIHIEPVRCDYLSMP